MAERAARINNELNSELPAIEEAADKENDTFAQGGPIAALNLAGKRREAQRVKRESASQQSGRYQSRDRSHLRSAEPSVGSAKKNQYQMYREPGDRQSVGIGNLARNGQNLPPKSRLSYQPKEIGEAYTPGHAPNKANDLVSHMNSKVSLPRIQSSRSNHMNMPSIMSRQESRQKMLEIQNRNQAQQDFSTQSS